MPDGPGPLGALPAGGVPTSLIDGVPAAGFDVTERGVFYVERSPEDTSVRYFDFATRRSTVIASNLGSVASGITVSRDGRTIMFSRIDSSVDDLILVDNFR